MTPSAIASPPRTTARPDRKSTRLNSSHGYISYAVFCLKKKKKKNKTIRNEPNFSGQQQKPVEWRHLRTKRKCATSLRRQADRPHRYRHARSSHVSDNTL